MHQTAAQIIDANGGAAAFAEAIGAEPGAVRTMKYRDKFSRTVWPAIIRAFPQLTVEKLEAAEQAAAKRDQAA